MPYLDFDLEIGPGDGRQYPVTARTASAETRLAMRFPFDEVALQSRLKDLQIALLRSATLRRRVLTDEEQAVQDFGNSLFSAVLNADALALFDHTRAQAAQQGLSGVRLRLRIHAPELAALPWEYLYDARQSEYICLSRGTPLVRYPESAQPIQPLKITPPLRILGMISSPADLDTLDVAREKERMQQALASLQQTGHVELTWLSGQTWEHLQEAMWGGPWHIFHFIGHGGFDPRSEEGVLALADDTGNTNLLSATQIGRLLANHSALRLVILNACEGGKSSSRDLFSSAAATLARRGIPAVLAMQYEITDQAAIQLTRTFYRALAHGLPVDAAVTEARTAISLSAAQTLEWGTPVLYLRASDSLLFDFTSQPAAHPPAPPLAEPVSTQAEANPVAPAGAGGVPGEGLGGGTPSGAVSTASGEEEGTRAGGFGGGTPSGAVSTASGEEEGTRAGGFGGGTPSGAVSTASETGGTRAGTGARGAAENAGAQHPQAPVAAGGFGGGTPSGRIVPASGPTAEEIAEHRKQYEQQLAQAEHAIAQDPADSDAHYNKASSLYALNRYADALKAFERAIELYPKFIWAYIGRAYALNGLKRSADALDSAERAITLIGKDHTFYREVTAAAFRAKGYALVGLKRPDDALAAFDYAIELEPNNLLAHRGKEAAEALLTPYRNTPLLTYSGHRNPIFALAWSPDGARLASSGSGKTVQIWDAQTGKTILSARRHASLVNALAWSPDGARLASASADKTIQIGEAATKQTLITYTGHAKEVYALIWLPDGQRLVSAGNEPKVHIWDAATGETLLTYKGHHRWVAALACSPDGTQIASASADGTVQIWEMATGSPLRTYSGHTGTVSALAWSPNGDHLASTGSEQTIHVWEAATGARLYTYTNHTSPVNALAWSPDSTRLASASADIHVWEATTGKLLCAYSGHTEPVRSLVWSPDGTRIASGSNDNTVHIWEPA